jgi:hypothetical protein
MHQLISARNSAGAAAESLLVMDRVARQEMPERDAIGTRARGQLGDSHFVRTVLQTSFWGFECGVNALCCRILNGR